MRLVILGGSGRVGKHVVREALKAGWKLTVFGRSFDQSLADRSEALDFIQGSLSNTNLLLKIVDGADACVHLVDTDVPSSSVRYPTRSIHRIIGPTTAFLSKLKSVRLGKLIYVSSGGCVYGEPLYLPIDEIHPTSPICPFGASKLATEHYIQLYGRLGGVRTIILRPSNIYGLTTAKPSECGVVDKILDSIAQEADITIFGNGSIIRDYIHVSDFVSALLLSCQSEYEKDAVFNVGTGEGHSISELLSLIEEITGRKPIFVRKKTRPWDVRTNILNCDRIIDVLNWNATIALKQGIELCWAARHTQTYSTFSQLHVSVS